MTDAGTRRSRGVLCVEVGFSAADMAQTAPHRTLKLVQDDVMGILGVRVKQGKKLANRDLFGKQDPYVVVKLLDFQGDAETVRVMPESR